MKLIYLLFSIIALSSLACNFDTKQPPVYREQEQKVKIEGGEKHKEVAKKASDNFQNFFNKGDFDALFDLLDEKSQLKSDRVYWDIRFSKIKNELGKLEKSEFARANVFQKSETFEVRIEYKTKFEKDDGAKPRYILFFWEIYKNGDVKLLNYINGIDNQKAY
jgi:hypothetical protein